METVNPTPLDLLPLSKMLTRPLSPFMQRRGNREIIRRVLRALNPPLSCRLHRNAFPKRTFPYPKSLCRVRLPRAGVLPLCCRSHQVYLWARGVGRVNDSPTHTFFMHVCAVESRPLLQDCHLPRCPLHERLHARRGTHTAFP